MKKVNRKITKETVIIIGISNRSSLLLISWVSPQLVKVALRSRGASLAVNFLSYTYFLCNITIQNDTINHNANDS